MSTDFCKIFNTPEYGQLVVLKDSNDEGAPYLKVMCMPPELGVCCAGMSWEDNDDGWEKLSAAFAEMTEERAVKFARLLWAEAENMAGSD